MKLATPRWWYRRKGAPGLVTRTVLRPVSWIWAAVTARRIASAAPEDIGVPVICVGNLTMGGAGKTPVAREILRRLAARGVAAHALLRGYGGKEAGPLRVDPARHSAADVGDEPLMLAQDHPTWIARDRAAGARAAAGAGAAVIVMDDGHQNPSIRKTLSLVVVDGETRNEEWPFGDGAVFPSGPMREPLAAGLARAGAVVLLMPADLPDPDPALVAVFGDKPVLVAHLQPAGALPAGPLYAFAGIGKPWKFERALRTAGADLAEFVPLPDHAPFTPGLLETMSAHAAGVGATLLTTEKDWVRLPADWRARIAYWPVRAAFDDAAIEALLARIV